VTLLTSPMAGKAPSELPNAVEPNTAQKRLHHIAQSLEFYREVFLDPRIPFGNPREQLRSAYEDTCDQLRRAIRGTKQNHHLAIKSLPRDKYLAIIEAVFTRPDDLFLSAMGKPCRTMLRDRAMTLLACEGLRPGTLGNVALRDFQPHSGHLCITDNRAKRTIKVTSNTPVLKLGDSIQVSSGSETMITLWPFTMRAIQDYIDSERDAVLLKRLTNRSSGFLFLSEQGEPIKHRSSITAMFNNLGQHLAELGFLDISNDPYFITHKQYDFYGYVLRHSAASFFLAEKCKEIAEQRGCSMPMDFKDVPDYVKDLMRIRFGWVDDSEMPEHYAKRALTDQANVTLVEFNQRLLDAAKERKLARDANNGL
jgi:integrase